jgi:hypothetical protein
MAKCAHCGNDYDKTFEIKRDGKTLAFDSFECAIHVMARRSVIIAAAVSSVTAWKVAVKYFAAPTAREKAVRVDCAIEASDGRRGRIDAAINRNACGA